MEMSNYCVVPRHNFPNTKGWHDDLFFFFASKWHPGCGGVPAQRVGLSVQLKPRIQYKGCCFKKAERKAQDVLFSNGTRLQLLTLLWSCVAWQHGLRQRKESYFGLQRINRAQQVQEIHSPHSQLLSGGYYHFVSSLSANSCLVSRAFCL